MQRYLILKHMYVKKFVLPCYSTAGSCQYDVYTTYCHATAMLTAYNLSTVPTAILQHCGKLLIRCLHYVLPSYSTADSLQCVYSAYCHSTALRTDVVRCLRHVLPLYSTADSLQCVYSTYCHATALLTAYMCLQSVLPFYSTADNYQHGTHTHTHTHTLTGYQLAALPYLHVIKPSCL